MVAVGTSQQKPAQVRFGSDSEVGRRNRDFRSASDSGHPAGGLGCPSSAKPRHRARKERKQKAARRRLSIHTR
jgi:hypothetical protein